MRKFLGLAAWCALLAVTFLERAAPRPLPFLPRDLAAEALFLLVFFKLVINIPLNPDTGNGPTP